MATFKHISSKNADYGAAEQYLTFEHDEFTMKPTLDENGRLIALVNKNWTLKLYFFAYNLQLLYGCICFPVLFGCQISQCVCWPFLVEIFYICLHLFWNVFALQMKICKQF